MYHHDTRTMFSQKRSARVILFCCAVLMPFLGSRPTAEEIPGNPSWVAIKVEYKYDGPAKSTVVGEAYYIGPIKWSPEFEPWNGRFTAKGNRYANLQIPVDFPLVACKTVTQPCGEQITISAGMNQRFWDDHLLPQGWENVSGPTTSSNCHSLATGLAFPEDSNSGVGVILSDDWERATISDSGEGDPGSCNYIPGGATIGVYGTGKSHSVLITEKCGPDNMYIMGRKAKWGVGPIYKKIENDCSLGSMGGAYVYYKKKNPKASEPAQP